MTGLELAAELAALDERKANLKAQLNDLKTERAGLETALLDALVAMGITSIRANTDTGRRTVYVHRQCWTRMKPGQEAAAIKAARDCGFGEAVTVNSNRMSGFVREVDGLANMPSEIQETFVETEVVSVRTRRSS